LSVFASTLPPATDLFVVPGEEAKVSVEIKNITDASVVSHIELRHVSLMQADGDLEIGERADDVSWISFSSTTLLLPPFESQAVTVTATPNAEVKEGVYTFALVSTREISGSITLSYGSASLLFVTVGELESRATCVAFVQNEDESFSLTVKNDGRGILYEEGSVMLRGMFSFPFVRADDNPRQHRVLPGQMRTWNTDRVSIPWWAFGPATASILSPHLSSCTPIFVAFRWIPIVGVVIAFACAAAIAKRRRRR
jgi:hypothetical protein